MGATGCCGESKPHSRTHCDRPDNGPYDHVHTSRSEREQGCAPETYGTDPVALGTRYSSHTRQRLRRCHCRHRHPLVWSARREIDWTGQSGGCSSATPQDQCGSVAQGLSRVAGQVTRTPNHPRAPPLEANDKEATRGAMGEKIVLQTQPGPTAPTHPAKGRRGNSGPGCDQPHTIQSWDCVLAKSSLKSLVTVPSPSGLVITSSALFLAVSGLSSACTVSVATSARGMAGVP